ncbi:hypothetical protein FOVG_16583 [Fusarium oxysporum f. sp. pisi HDV247]|uniref:PNPLA domain-containing protein n=1 Tax=Fusarium oxysporum f. sp. pisi HDV247 TaxID=1080344 RepID=W9NQF0_FUSOX|nr:hypothetical protein FOVG_16583 [Fusarium oxysporum f. sp. pisi HDV247]
MQVNHKSPRGYEDYTVAIICAIGFEMSAVRYMLDRERPRLPTKEGDANIYVLGELSGHNVVLATLPGNQGKGAAATVATNMTRTFPSIKWRFLVGIGGGVPSDKHDIRLGDVVVSMPEGPYGGVIQYDLGKDIEDDFQLKGFLWPPPTILRSAVEMMRSDHLTADNKVVEFLSQMLKKSQRLSAYARPPVESDILFKPDYPHVPGQSTCEKCDRANGVARPRRASDAPEIHYGLIASGDRVVKSATKRHLAAQAVGDILCFEMEAAGIATEFSCVVIRGISDYADSHKNDGWHHYAAAAAAALVKELLSYLSPEKPPIGLPLSCSPHLTQPTQQTPPARYASAGAMPVGNLRLLALDGGGVRGLSSLMILRRLMATVDPDAPPKPCDYFDMIGGTSTGGLIAVMLGRLRMTVDECIDAYTSLSDKVFEKKSHKVNIKGKLKGRFDAAELERSIKRILVARDLSEDTLLKDFDAPCKIFVCATSKETSDTVCLASYSSPRSYNSDLLNSIKIWQACRATCAATTLFDPVALGPFSEEFVDGALGANNPVYALWGQAKDMWGDQLQAKLKCLVSIGTGVPSVRPVRDDVLGIWATLKELAIETEKTAQQFHRDKSNLDDEGRYYRFNVDRGLEDIGLEESKKKKEIAAATRRYVESQAVFKQMKACANNLATGGYFRSYKTPFSLEVTSASRKITPQDSPCANFVDRPAYLTTLRTFFWNYVDGKSQSFVLWGLGGVGKTQLALKFVEALKDRVSIIWIRADSSSNFSLDYSKALHPLLNRPEQSWQPGAFDGSLNDHLEMTRAYLELHPSEWLLILDNADEIEDFRNFMWKYLPQHGRILVTTRDPRFQGEFTEPDDGLNIIPMDDEQGLELLTKSIPTRLRAKHKDTVLQSQDLLFLLGNLPLAIAQAAANIVDQQISLTEYVEQFRKASDRFEALKAPIRNGRTKDPRNSTQSVNFTWQISFERLEASSPLSVVLLAYISCFHWESIPRDLLRKLPEFSALSDVEFRDVLARPIQLSLLEEYDTDSWAQLRMHPLVHEYSWKRVGDLSETILRTCSQAMAAIFPAVLDEKDDNWQLCSYLAAHALRIVDLSNDQRLESKGLAVLMQTLSCYLNVFGNVATACDMSSKALDMAKGVWPEGDPSVNSIRQANIDCLRNGGRFEDALRELDACLEYLETDAAKSCSENNIPTEKYWALGIKGDLLGRIKLHDESCRIAKEMEVVAVAPDGVTWTATTLIAKHDTAYALNLAGRSDDARPIVEAVFANVEGPDGKLRVPRRSYMAFLNLKARLLLEKPRNFDDPGKALHTYRTVYQESFETWGVSDVDTWIAASNVLRTLEEHPHLEADSLQAREVIVNQILEACAAPGAKQVRTHDSGKFHRSIIVFLWHLDMLITDGQLQGRRANHEHLLELREVVLTNFVLRGDVAIGNLGGQNFMGVCLQRGGRPEWAEALHREAIQGLLAWQALGPQRPKMLDLSSEQDIQEALSTYHYNVMLSIARQGRVKDALRYREDQGSVIEFAEGKYGALEKRLEMDERDRMVYEEARHKIERRECKEEDADGWWAEHVAEVLRAETRYGPLTKQTGMAGGDGGRGWKTENGGLESSNLSERNDVREGGVDAVAEEKEVTKGERHLRNRLKLALWKLTLWRK